MVSSTEPARLRELGTVNTKPEQWGVDFLWVRARDGKPEWYGVQRKELKDLLASVQDGRLGKELAQMQGLARAMLVVEGRARFTLDGELVNSSGFGKPWTRSQYRGVLWSIQNSGIWVDTTESIDETAIVVQMFERWTRKEAHTSLVRREPVAGLWGRAGHEDYARHLLMGFPGVGVELAARIVRRFGGAPLRWDCTREELMTVDGVGNRKAEQLIKALARGEV